MVTHIVPGSHQSPEVCWKSCCVSVRCCFCLCFRFVCVSLCGKSVCPFRFFFLSMFLFSFHTHTHTHTRAHRHSVCVVCLCLVLLHVCVRLLCCWTCSLLYHETCTDTDRQQQNKTWNKIRWFKLKTFGTKTDTQALRPPWAQQVAISKNSVWTLYSWNRRNAGFIVVYLNFFLFETTCMELVGIVLDKQDYGAGLLRLKTYAVSQAPWHWSPTVPVS